ncbi:MAG: phosphatase PAP2 family protein [Bacteroidota bacterium]|nr:phosphatase PAP2 family protein [Bacteroidota bacterium]
MKETNQPIKKLNSSRWILSAATAKKTLLFTALFLVVFLVWVVFIYGRNSFDQSAFLLIGPYTTETRTALMRFISFLGKHTFLIPAIILLIGFFLYRKNKWMAIRTTTVLLSSLLLMSLLKTLIKRKRPPDPLVEGITNFSFPSGHAFMSVAFYGLLIWFSSVYIRDKWTRRIITFFLLLIIAGIGFSRIYLRVHYATDVIAGICFGFLWLDFCLWFIDKKEAALTKK